MLEILVTVTGVGVLVGIGLLVLVLKRLRAEGPDESEALIGSLDTSLQRFDRLVKEEITRNRQESSNQSRSHREEMSKAYRDVSDNLLKTLAQVSDIQRKQLGAILGRVQLLRRKRLDVEVDRNLAVMEKAAQDGRETVRRIQEFARTQEDDDFFPVDLGLAAGVSIEGNRLQVDLGWTVGGRVLSFGGGQPGATEHPWRQAQLVTGPAVGLTIPVDQRVDLLLDATVQGGVVPDVRGPQLQPWFGITAGLEFGGKG